ncbi:MAG: diaminopimelate epimerase [Clostridia bacterium]|nr:diaminopimelate epimerase [Clostridia bacterium]MBR5903512.1 diaminopimelate epimerase [Clostridia bacterium]
MRFTKMHGLGNDYIYVFGMPDAVNTLAVKLSDRHFGIGADGIIVIDRSDAADFSMRIFNADGSEAKMCGNGIRCVGKYVYDKGYTDKTKLTIDTLSGVRKLSLEVENGKVSSVQVDMGQTRVGEREALKLADRCIDVYPVSVGNPHCVTFVPDVMSVPLDTLGVQVEKHPRFPDGVNAEFVQVIDEHTLRMRVWERGSGITMACGTGATACAAAAVKAGYCTANTPVTVILDGGELHITVTSDGSAQMSGPATTVFEGETTDNI